MGIGMFIAAGIGSTLRPRTVDRLEFIRARPEPFVERRLKSSDLQHVWPGLACAYTADGRGANAGVSSKLANRSRAECFAQPFGNYCECRKLGSRLAVDTWP